MIHSVDSVTLAQRLNSLGEGMGRPLAVLLEFNVGGEPGKHGWGAADPAAWPQLLADMETVVNLAHLHVRGLMTMPPLAATPEDSRRFFDLLRQLQGYLVENVTGADWTELSMGTSSDFTVAVEEGATLVRVGEAILGPRITRETK
jgi:hypothetical protein